MAMEIPYQSNKVVSRPDRLYERVVLEPRFFLESLVEITDKDRQTVPFILNPSQCRYYNSRSLRDIILKPRQLGFSTEIMGLFLHDTMFVPNTVSVIVAHTDKDASDLFERARFMFNSIPNTFKPNVGRSNVRELFFDKVNSRFFIGSAEAKHFGISKTINNLHITEASHPYYKEDFLIGIMESVPRSGRIVLESTARGEGNIYHIYYMDAKEKHNEFKVHYYRWFEHSEYQIDLLPGERLNLDEEERELIKKFRLTMSQIKWRREKKGRLGKKFIQEYPELEDDDAFIKSGSPVFDGDWLKARDNQLLEQNPQEIWLGGDLFIYKIAEGGARYVIGCDTSEGDINSDFSAASVIKCFPLPIEQVALLVGRWTPDIFSEKVYKMGLAYNKAIIGVERNNHGHAVLLNLSNGIVRAGTVRYPSYPEIYAGMDRKLGWLTSGLTKPIMIEELDRAMRSGQLIVNSKRFLSEARKFQYKAANKMGAPSGGHDDIVMANAVAIMVIASGGFDWSFT